MIKKLIHNSNKTSKTYNKEGEKMKSEICFNIYNFISHFIDLGYNLSQNIFLCSRKTETYINKSKREFIFSEITVQEICQLLLSLSLTKAPALDKLPAFRLLLNWPRLILLNLLRQYSISHWPDLY